MEVIAQRILSINQPWTFYKQTFQCCMREDGDIGIWDAFEAALYFLEGRIGIWRLAVIYHIIIVYEVCAMIRSFGGNACQLVKHRRVGGSMVKQVIEGVDLWSFSLLSCSLLNGCKRFGEALECGFWALRCRYILSYALLIVSGGGSWAVVLATP